VTQCHDVCQEVILRRGHHDTPKRPGTLTRRHSVISQRTVILYDSIQGCNWPAYGS